MHCHLVTGPEPRALCGGSAVHPHVTGGDDRREAAAADAGAEPGAKEAIEADGRTADGAACRIGSGARISCRRVRY
jgi:hypothetical protein